MAQPEQKIPGLGTPSEVVHVEDYANISHQKADVGMITITRDRLEHILSATSSLSSNFFTLMLGAAGSVFLALKSGGIDPGWISTFQLALIGSLVFAAFFGILTVNQEWKKYKFRQELKPPNERWPKFLWPH